VGRQQIPNRLDAIQKLFAEAAEAADRQDWLSAHIFYSELCNLNESSFSRVLRLEAARLLGLIDALGAVEVPSPGEIIETLGIADSKHLLAALLRARGFRLEQFSQAEIDVITSDRTLLASFISGYGDALDEKDLERHGVRIASCLTIRAASSESIEIFAPYEAALPVLRVVSSAHVFDQSPRKTRFLSAPVMRLSAMNCTVGSELMSSDANFFVDGLLLEGAKTADTRDDFRVLFAEDSRVHYLSNTDLSPIVLEDAALWLAYASTESWGEWFNYSLARATLAAEVDFMGARTAVVAAETPETYLTGLSDLFPKLSIVRLPRGTSVHARELVVVPARFCNPSHEYWSLEGDSRRVHSEPETSSVVGKHLRRLVSSVDLSTTGRVFMSRADARYRRGNAEQILQLVAAKHGFEPIEMGRYTLAEQVTIASSGRTFFGQCGSNWDLLSSVIEPGAEALFVHHDRPNEWSAQAWVIEMAGANCEFVLGSRSFLGIGYGPETYHLPVHLDKDRIDAVEKWLDNR
jgi:hypothetical protein